MKILLFICSLCSAFVGYSQTVGEETSYEHALNKMFEASGTAEVFEVTVNNMIQSQKAQNPEVPAEFWDAFQQEMTKNSMQDLITRLIPVYKKYMTKEDLEVISNFYLSPVGKKLAEKSPKITEEAMQVGREWGMEIGSRIVNEISEFKKD